MSSIFVALSNHAAKEAFLARGQGQDDGGVGEHADIGVADGIHHDGCDNIVHYCCLKGKMGVGLVTLPAGVSEGRFHLVESCSGHWQPREYCCHCCLC